SFQEYFVRENCEPHVTGFEFKGVDEAKPAPGVLQAVEDADVVLICPSNPWVSIDPILKVDGVRDTIQDKQVVTISPIIGG
ncbi:MAG: 2-phospho-L-lactate transferase, partial [Aliifodinibius sp.]|nr:2-phospho-L-lactate transferase [candidate division Zixibacteria bacterium]NIT58354.1 2-phospho-L-lactate transferase [Fodinibius sp.]NIR65094.1 2-phospho-L-lactate transferase [candidate division Zixibacteria bacterium]NIS46838.1 2-phospho-L-lactate transferase [candidate division Zixibacteria bacterium]NIU14983.1 2-phospho-L-lactate transferase [candidate division Zixibacteria bacterium]